jgi:CRISPR-associated protein Csd1
MTILQSLNNAYTRLAARGEVAPFGYSPEKIAYVIELRADGSVRGKPTARGPIIKNKQQPAIMVVPQATKRTVGIASNFLWDKSPYVLGVPSEPFESIKDDKERAKREKRTLEEHAAFIAMHRDALDQNEDEGLKALHLFLSSWSPDNFQSLEWPDDMRGQNIAFSLGIGASSLIHERAASQALWSLMNADADAPQAQCLVSGVAAPVARLHGSIKGVPGAQSSGASLVSFNQDSFSSYGHDQGENAPVSEQAMFGYTTALNHFLRRGGEGERHPNKIQVGDTNVVFWAEAPDQELVELAEAAFPAFMSDAPNEGSEAKKIGNVLDAIRSGTIDNLVPNLQSGVTFNILGLAPNAARLSIRFWLQDSFGSFVANYQRFLSDMALEPRDEREPHPALWKLLRETAVQGKAENVAPLLAGEWLRAILTGGRYPLTLLSAVLTRIKADGEINTRRVSILRALLVRNFNSKEAPVAFDPENENRGYLLGRLFATYVKIQEDALGKDLNSSIKDKYYGSASAQPRKVFRLLDSGSTSHLSKLGKDKPGAKVNSEKLLSEIMGHMSPDADPFPASLSTEEQALFGLGYHHQRGQFFKPRADNVANSETEIKEGPNA